MIKTRNKIPWRLALLFALGTIFITNSVNADYIMTAPPREKPERGKAMYEPIAEYLSKILGEPVVYEQPTGWFDYSKKMREGKYDIVFDGPHFSAWRIKNLKHVPVAVLPGKLGFVLITWADSRGVQKIRDLVGKKICALYSPNLGTGMLYKLFSNPVLQPQLYGVRGGFKKVYQAFRQGNCRAAILRDNVYNKTPSAEKKQLKILVKTKPLPNQTITVSKRLRSNAAKISRVLTSKEGAIAADVLLSRFSKKKKYFKQARVTEYAGVEQVLEGVVWGW